MQFSIAELNLLILSCETSTNANSQPEWIAMDELIDRLKGELDLMTTELKGAHDD